jgi:hypothetical protein
VPVDGTGLPDPEPALPDGLQRQQFHSSGWTSITRPTARSRSTIQLGSKIFNITNDYAVQALGADGVSASALSADRPRS